MTEQSQRAKNELKFQNDLKKIFKDLRNDNEKAPELVELLEKESFDAYMHNLEFCQAYTIKLIQTYCRDCKDKRGHNRKKQDTAELMLATYGLLKGFEFEPQKKDDRVTRYCTFVHENNNYNALIRQWSSGSALTRTRDILDDTEADLTDLLNELTCAGEKDLGLINEVKLPLVLPQPYIFEGSQPLPDDPGADDDKIISLLKPFKKIKEYFSARDLVPRWAWLIWPISFLLLLSLRQCNLNININTNVINGNNYQPSPVTESQETDWDPQNAQRFP